jgi:hypothetical protein
MVLGNIEVDGCPETWMGVQKHVVGNIEVDGCPETCCLPQVHAMLYIVLVTN